MISTNWGFFLLQQGFFVLWECTQLDARFDFLIFSLFCWGENVCLMVVFVSECGLLWIWFRNLMRAGIQISISRRFCRWPKREYRKGRCAHIFRILLYHCLWCNLVNLQSATKSGVVRIFNVMQLIMCCLCSPLLFWRWLQLVSVDWTMTGFSFALRRFKRSMNCFSETKCFFFAFLFSIACTFLIFFPSNDALCSFHNMFVL